MCPTVGRSPNDEPSDPSQRPARFQRPRRRRRSYNPAPCCAEPVVKRPPSSSARSCSSCSAPASSRRSRSASRRAGCRSRSTSRGASRVTLGIYVSAGVSGAHLNPAVTLALAALRGFPWRKVPAYVARADGGRLLRRRAHVPDLPRGVRPLRRRHAPGRGRRRHRRHLRHLPAAVPLDRRRLRRPARRYRAAAARHLRDRRPAQRGAGDGRPARRGRARRAHRHELRLQLRLRDQPRARPRPAALHRARRLGRRGVPRRRRLVVGADRRPVPRRPRRRRSSTTC